MIKNGLILACLWVSLVSSIGTTILLSVYCANFFKENLNLLIFYSYLISIAPSLFLLKILLNKISKPIENVKSEVQKEVEIPLEKDTKIDEKLEVKKEREVKNIEEKREESIILKQLQSILIEVNRLKTILKNLENVKEFEKVRIDESLKNKEDKD